MLRYPLCALCGAKAVEVDHKIPKRQGGSDDESNTQSICRSCHARKTKRENPVRKIILLVILSCLCTACGGPMMFAREGGTTQHLQADQYECQREWNESAMGQQFARDPIQYASYGFNARGIMQRCMEHRGWTRQ